MYFDACVLCCKKKGVGSKKKKQQKTSVSFLEEKKAWTRGHREQTGVKCDSTFWGSQAQSLAQIYEGSEEGEELERALKFSRAGKLRLYVWVLYSN